MISIYFRAVKDCHLPVPTYQSEGASGIDLQSNAAVLEIEHGESVLVPTGFRVNIPPGYEGQIRPRSGLALKHGVTVLNAPGTIDSDYRGEIKVLLINHGAEPFAIAYGDRIAQLVIAPVARCEIGQGDDTTWSDTARGDGGFGSTGHKCKAFRWRVDPKPPGVPLSPKPKLR